MLVERVGGVGWLVAGEAELGARAANNGGGVRLGEREERERERGRGERINVQRVQYESGSVMYGVYTEMKDVGIGCVQWTDECWLHSLSSGMEQCLHPEQGWLVVC